MDELFFLVSGESPTLPFSEVKSILEAEGFIYDVVERLSQVLRLRANSKCIEVIKFRSSMTRLCCIEILNCRAEIREILKHLRKVDLSRFLNSNDTFAVRVRRVQDNSNEISRLLLERKIGEELVKAKSARVNLRKPKVTFLGVLTDDRFVFGIIRAEMNSKGFTSRGSQRKSFTFSATMSPKLARCMVNLAQPRSGELVMDPFCGTGSFLVEAGLIGCNVLGFDVKRRMVEGSSRNLISFGVKFLGMVLSDARFLPLTNDVVDCVTTDPPYGTSTTTLGLDADEIFKMFLSRVGQFLKYGSRICISAPKKLKVKEIGENLGLKHIESHEIYIHRSLTREVNVFKV